MQKPKGTVLPPPLSSTDHILGLASAPVTVIEYADFECPYCRAAYPAVRILLNHFKNGVCFAYRHFPVLERHPHAERAAEAAETAGAQGKFWPMHDLLFENQPRLSDVYLRQYARQATLELPRYDQDMDSHRHLPLVHAQMNRGKAAGTRGTPTFFVNGVIEDVSFGMEGLYQAIAARLSSVSTS